MSGRPREGHQAESRTREETPAIPEQNPLDFALAFMRDDSKPDALRVSVAKAAMPYLHKRGEEQGDEQEDAPEPKPRSEPMSDLELARRIAHILARGKEQVERERAGVLHAPTPPGALRAPPSPEGEGEEKSRHAVAMPSENVPDDVSLDDERGQRDDPFDPHPGYRWIP
jgi:hypothetical protein